MASIESVPFLGTAQPTALETGLPRPRPQSYKDKGSLVKEQTRKVQNSRTATP